MKSKLWLSNYLVGLDLGQASDPTALVVLKRMVNVYEESDQERVARVALGLPAPVDPPMYHVPFLERFPLDTLYSAVAQRVSDICRKDPLAGNVQVVVDQTGVGRGVIEMVQAKLRDILWPIPVTITGGNVVSRDPKTGSFHVPKRDLVSVMAVVLQSGRFKIANVPERENLTKEFLNFKIKVSLSGNDTYEAWREGDHDDLVLGAAMAVWYGETQMTLRPPENADAYNKPLVNAINRLAKG